MSKAKILIVEDEAITGMDVQRRLQRLGYEVAGRCETGTDAIRKARETLPDVILMDINLKDDVDGITAAEIINAERRTPTIFVTAYSDEKTLERAKITEPFGYLLKPVEERELQITIEVALYRHKMELERDRLSRELLESNTRVKVLGGLLPICACCKQIRDDKGYWSQVEVYIREHSEAQFTHGLCPKCADETLEVFLKQEKPANKPQKE
ncbi:MAG: two component system response regulator [Verrucomicrobiales bacterium]|nr:two component system response regulator [Verrucomicrobiales bacterium]